MLRPSPAQLFLQSPFKKNLFLVRCLRTSYQAEGQKEKWKERVIESGDPFKEAFPERLSQSPVHASQLAPVSYSRALEPPPRDVQNFRFRNFFKTIVRGFW
jgi:hypothetical protein